MAAIPPLAIVGITALTGVISGVGTFMQTQSQQAAQAASARQNAAVMQYNAQVARVQAEMERQMGAQQETIIRERSRRAIATGLAEFGASGVAMEGSPLMVIGDSLFQAERDAITARNNAAFSASLAESTAGVYETKSSWLRNQAKTGSDFSPLALGGSILTAGLNAYTTGAKLGQW